MNLLSSFKRIYKRLSACQFYTLALSESTMWYTLTGNIAMLLRNYCLTPNQS
jgi:hypothetical protein